MYACESREIAMVGMPDVAVRESRQRIKSALANSGYRYAGRCVTINLAPANIRKEGAGFDLPMALEILGAMGAVGKSESHLLVGELSLDGSLRAVRGALPESASAPDFCDVKGQTSTKRALKLAAAGAHNVVMIGPPGSGKTMLARRMAGILPYGSVDFRVYSIVDPARFRASGIDVGYVGYESINTKMAAIQ